MEQINGHGVQQPRVEESPGTATSSTVGHTLRALEKSRIFAKYLMVMAMVFCFYDQIIHCNEEVGHILSDVGYVWRNYEDVLIV